MFRLNVGFLILILSASLMAATAAEDFARYKNYSKSLGNQALQEMQRFNPEKVIENYQSSPDETSYYKGVESEKDELSAHAMATLNQDKNHREIYGKLWSQPKFEISKDSDAVLHGKLIEEESFNITHGISNEKVQCHAIPSDCKPSYHQETCQSGGHFPIQRCTKERHISFNRDLVSQTIGLTFNVQGSARPYSASISVNLFTGAVIGVSGSVSAPIQLPHACHELVVVSKSIDVTQSKKGHGWIRSIGIGQVASCANAGIMTINFMSDSSRTLTVSMVLEVKANSEPFNLKEVWEQHCDGMGAGAACQIIDQEKCTQGPETRVIEGLPFTRDCWASEAQYSCKSPSVNSCDALKSKGCQPLQSKCIQMLGSVCTQYEQVYQCPDKSCQPQVVCAKDIFCADGNCTEHVSSESDEFAKSASQLAVAGAVGQEYSQAPVNMFAGKSVKCDVIPGDFLNCCSEKGWGKKLNLAHCSSDEKELGQAKKKYLAHYIGKYCDEKDPILGICLKWKNSYCVFSNKMARIIQEEGRLTQLNPQALGSAKEPSCIGLTLEELQHLDMSRINFINPIYPFQNDEGRPEVEAGIAGDIQKPKLDSQETLERVNKQYQAKVGGA